MAPEIVPPAYPKVSPLPDLPALERAVLDSWRREGTFEQSVENRPTGERGANEYVFYDGPPFANGLPHYGHLLTGYVKDVVPRYQTMRGRRVERRFGWDCHGLPAEMAAEQELGVSGRRRIIEYGIAEFNAHCRSSVLRYTGEWERYVTRQARWVDFTNDYKTMDLSYMESVMWAFAQLWAKGLIYEAYRVMPYSWGAQTPLSNFEIRLDDATRPRQDPALTVAFELEPEPGDPGPLRLLAWTTTPWTLPSNLALAVGPDIDYAIFAEDRDDGPVYYVLGAETVANYERQLDGARQHGSITGRELVDRRYRPLFPYFADRADSFRVLGDDFVDTSEGTGIVHIAPGFGEDDQRIGEAAGIGIVVPVDDEGAFTSAVVDWAGQNVFEANDGIIAQLKAQGAVVLHETYDHNYPHCWRTDTPIIYRALSSWFVEVTAIRDRMLEHNQKINWIPDHVRDGRFGNWLAGARDWSISRNRFWGSPIPVWRSDDPDHPRIDVYGSLDEIERDFGVRPDDLHRPFIDELTRPNPDDPSGRSTMRRVPEVLDCWFESGSMPYAQVHYPFENKEWFEHHFPADFIVEYINQTRGWFYTLHVLSTALFDRPPFENAICHGIVLAADGSKLSKRLKNYPDPDDVFAQYGSDALRWYLMASPVVRGGDLRIKESEISDVTRLVINPVWSAYSFFTLFANADGARGRWSVDSQQLLDRYILAKTRQLVEAVTARMDAYDLPGACGEVTGYIDALNNWYIRRSRDRFWAPASDDASAGAGKQAAYDTLFTVLSLVCRTAAPLLPLLSEAIYRGITGEASVHLADWPDPDVLPAEPELVARMDRVREICSTGLALRKDNGLRTRLPLRRLTVAGPGVTGLEPFVHLIRAEMNVHEVELTDDLEAHARTVLRPDGRRLGPRLGGAVQEVFAAAKRGEWKRRDDTIEVAGQLLGEGDYEIGLEALDTSGGSRPLRTNDAVVTIDTTITDELANEGLARDVVRQLQQGRRDRDFDVTDRITVRLDGSPALLAAVDTHRDYIAEQVLATDLRLEPLDGDGCTTVEVEGHELRFALER